MMGTILVTSRSFSSGSLDLVARLTAAGHTVVRGPADHNLAAMSELLDAAIGWIAGTGPVGQEHLAAGPRLRVIARYGVGYEAVDLNAAKGRGILVTNTPGANNDAVADHTIGLILAVLRSIPEGDRRVRAGNWTVARGRELGSMRVGIVGFGRIGQGVAKRLRGFGSQVYAHDPALSVEQAAGRGAQTMRFADMSSMCDIVSLHAPGGRQLVDESWLSAAQPGMVLINTARPDLIDEEHLHTALTGGKIAGFAADTLVGDTAASGSPLLDPDLADRVVVTPHFGAQTVEAVDRMGSIAVTNLLAVLNGTAPPNEVFPPDN